MRFGASALAIGLMGLATEASACNLSLTGLPPGSPIANWVLVGACGGANAAAGIAGMNTALAIDFQTFASPFVTSGNSTTPNALQSGVWVRGIGGQNTVSTSVSGSIGPFSASTSSKVTTDYSGFQAGIDSGPLNIGGSGWNLHVGLMGGMAFADADHSDVNGALNTTDPFLGVYAVFTKDYFFGNLQVRHSWSTTDISQPSNGLQSATLNANSWDTSGAIGYRIVFGSAFLEPSAGFDIANTQADSVALSIPNATGIGQIESFDTTLGYVGARLGTAVSTSSLALQPYVSASLWNQFSGDINANLSCISGSTCGLAQKDLGSTTLHATASQIGTFGQFGVGVAGQVLKTGLVGYVRADLRVGTGYEANAITGGLRYSF